MHPGLYISAAVISATMLLAFAAAGLWWLRRRRYELVLFAAFLEQGRRELGHHIPYRTDNRVHAIQQRLARHLGERRAYSKTVERDILAGLGS